MILVRCELSGKLIENATGPRYWLTAKDMRTSVDGEKRTLDGINIACFKTEKERLFKDMKPDKFYPVKLTVTVKQEKLGHWIATVSEIETGK